MNLFELFIKIGVDDQASGEISKLSQSVGAGLAKATKVGVSALSTLGTVAVKSFADYEQLAGGAAKIFDEMSQTKVLNDANNAYKELGLSANQYLAIINDVGATFAATMGDEAGYNTAKTGLKAISDYASGTGKNVDLLSEKFTMITRSTSSYQSIADQFSGILPATSKDFLAQAQAAGILSDSYTELTQVPIAEYQAAVSQMLQRGVAELGLANNTVLESETTISGSFMSMKAAASNFMVSLVDDNASVTDSFNVMKETAITFVDNVTPKIMEFLGAISPIATTVAGMTGAFVAFKTAAAISSLLGTLTTAWKAYRVANEGATVAQWLLNTAMSANPIVLVVTLLGGLVAAMITLWKTNDDLRKTLINSWNAIKEKADNVWKKILKFFKEDIPSALKKVITFVKENWASLLLLLTNPIAGALKLLYDLNPKFRSWVNGVKDSITNGFSNLVQSAKTWGKDLLDNFINGIKAKWDALKNTVGQTAQSIKDYLGFSEPEKGPLSNFHTYAPDMMDLFIKGIRDNEKKLTNQIEKTFDFGEKTIQGTIGLSSGVDGFGGRRSVSVVQNIYSQAKTAADLMQEALLEQERAVFLNV